MARIPIALQLYSVRQDCAKDLPGTLAAVGLYVLPNRRRKAREELRANVADLQERLHAALATQFEQELARLINEIREAIEPYTRYIGNEREKLETNSQNLDHVEQEARNLQARIDLLSSRSDSR